MTRGLVVPLSPQEEIALRRIAHGSVVVDAEAARRLVSLALVERVRAGPRLTPLGRLRFEGLLQAPLLATRRSVHSVAGYVEGLIEKAQARVAGQPPPLPPVGVERVETEATRPAPAVQPLAIAFDTAAFFVQAQRNNIDMRQRMKNHRESHAKLSRESWQRIASSRLLLQITVPFTRQWRLALR